MELWQTNTCILLVLNSETNVGTPKMGLGLGSTVKFHLQLGECNWICEIIKLV